MKLGASYSTICENELLSKLVPLYEFEKPQSCRFWQRGINDTYQIVCAENTYSLRIYRHGLRTLDAIEFEMAALDHLRKRGASVAFPIARQDGKFVSELQAPEGLRHVIVTAYAKGAIPEYEDQADASLYGESVAQIHSLSDDFQTDHNRPRLDIEYLLDTSLDVIGRFLVEESDDLGYLTTTADDLRKNVSGVSMDNLDVGFCHGDCHGDNVHNENGILTHYDFDCCGLGLRLYDLATFKWGVLNDNDGDKLWTAFLDAYRASREIGEANLGLIETFIIIRHIWWMALLCGSVQDFGYADHSKDFVHRQIRNIKRIWERN